MDAGVPAVGDDEDALIAAKLKEIQASVARMSRLYIYF